MIAGDTLRRGLAANYLGKAFCALLSLFALPILYRQLGGEAFGLFGLFFSVQALLGIFDFGVGAAMQRDLAALQARSFALRPSDVVATLRSIERVLWTIAIIACVLAACLSSFVSTHWLDVRALPVDLVSHALLWMVIAAALQFLGNFYLGCLNGLRLHSQTNTMQSSVWALRFVMLLFCVQAGFAPAASMSLAVLPVLQVWTLANALLLVWARLGLLRALPQASGVPGVAYLRQAARFGLPLVATTTLIMLFNQTDKIAASRLLPLDSLGKYTIVWSIAEVMYLVYQPIYTSFLPIFAGRFATARDTGNTFELGQSITLAWRMMTVAVFPAAVILFALPGLVILAWTGDVQLSQRSAAVLRWVIVGASVNAFLFIPFALQQAAGDMRPWTWRVALALLLYLPLSIYAINGWGMLGAAAAWSAGSICLALWLARTSVRSVRRGRLQDSPLPSLLPDSLKTLLFCSAVAVLAALLPWPSGRYGAAALAIGSLFVCGLVALRSQPDIWAMCMQGLQSLRNFRYGRQVP